MSVGGVAKPTVGSLFSGYAGLDLAVEKVTGASTVWHSEIESAPAAVLAERFPESPNLGDVTAVNWFDIQPVDILCGGWPCQPFSLAGKRLGALDDRALWPYVESAIRILRPRLVVLENVAAVLTAGEFDRVQNDLAKSGYDTQWACLRAADVGAPHGRNRLFIVATNTASVRRWAQRPESAGLIGATRFDRYGIDPAPDPYGDPVGEQPVAESRGGGESVVGLAGVEWGAYKPAVRRWERVTGRLAPEPTELGPRGRRLSVRFVEWMQGLRAGWVTDVPGVSRNDQLKMLGNGVVPQQAAAALGALLGVGV